MKVSCGVTFMSTDFYQKPRLHDEVLYPQMIIKLDD